MVKAQKEKFWPKEEGEVQASISVIIPQEASRSEVREEFPRVEESRRKREMKIPSFSWNPYA